MVGLESTRCGPGEGTTSDAVYSVLHTGVNERGASAPSRVPRAFHGCQQVARPPSCGCASAACASERLGPADRTQCLIMWTWLICALLWRARYAKCRYGYMPGAGCRAPQKWVESREA